MLSNPITDVAFAYHDSVNRFSSYEKINYRKETITVNPNQWDITVEYMFPQTWPSTNCGFGGIGGQAFTDAYTVVVKHYYTDEYAIYVNNTFSRVIKSPNEKFYEDMKNKKYDHFGNYDSEVK